MWDVRAMSLQPLIEVSLTCLGRNPVNCVTWANIIIPLSMQPARVMAVVTEPAIGLTKLALMLFYYRLFSRHFATKLGIFAGLALIVPLYTALFFLFLFLDTTATTATNKAISVLNVVSDFYILVLALPAVLGLHLPAKKKVGLVALFSAGLL